MQRIQSSRSGFGFGRYSGGVSSPYDGSGRSTPADRSMRGGVKMSDSSKQVEMKSRGYYR